jgi:tetratricopeptide (TPR) repeat protein
VLAGLTWHTFRWALTSTQEGDNWLPVTWISHALDCQLFGLDAGYHHLSSLFLHVLNAILLFLLLRIATGATGPSFLVAALFAWHPLNVESVAWIAERKNVLSTFFLLLTIAAYAWYARKPDGKRMAAVTGLFLLAIASKPMAVTLPCALLLLDYWPLRRVACWTQASSEFPAPQKRVVDLLLEKIPLFVLAAAESAITVWAQRFTGAVKSLHEVPFGQRVENAAVSYLAYIGKTLWPSGLAIHYPLQTSPIALWKPVLAGAVLIAISTGVWRERRKRAYLLVGWLWFVGTLVPVIGLVQVGDQAMADRYAYVPLLGIFVMGAWVAFEWLTGSKLLLRIGACAILLLPLALVTVNQIGYWKNSVTVWTQAQRVTPDNVTLEMKLAEAFQEANDRDSANLHLLRAEAMEPQNLVIHLNLGALALQEQRMGDSILELETAVSLSEQRKLSRNDMRYRTSALLDLGFAYALSRNYPKAFHALRQAGQGDQEVVHQTTDALYRTADTTPTEEAYIDLFLLLRATSTSTKAFSEVEPALRRNPQYSNLRELFGSLGAVPE